MALHINTAFKIIVLMAANVCFDIHRFVCSVNYSFLVRFILTV